MITEIEVVYKSEKIHGNLINEDEKYLTLKLSSGYNIILDKKETQIISKKEIEKEISKKKEIVNNQKSKELPNILIIHTGGTIASKVDYRTGAVSSKFTPEELLNLFPELNEIVNIDAVMIGNLFSEDMNFSHYNLMLREIKKQIAKNKFDGIIISHGTDTMHYTSAALNYALKNLTIPIILIGAQRSSDRPSSDAFLNLKAGIEFIIKNKELSKKYCRVGICMHEGISDENFLILDGINVKKLHSSRRDAFKQINYLPVAKIDESFNIKILREELLIIPPKEKLQISEYDEKLKVGFFKAHPNLFPEEIERLEIYDGVVIEGTGLGQFAVTENKENLNTLKKLTNRIPVIIGTQTTSGKVNLNVYSAGRDIQGANVYGNLLNLTTETLFIRMAYCLSQKNNFSDCWKENLEDFEIRSIDTGNDFE